MNTKVIIEIIKNNNIYPNKKLGQNFICNNGILNKIIEFSNITEKDKILEIGPGLGALTAVLLEKANSLTAIEIDAGLYKFLKMKFQNKRNLILIHEDFLKTNINQYFTKVIANLPYYCSSEILFQLALKYKINEIFLMLQKEMADRILSRPGVKTYGALTVTIGLYYESSILFNIDKKSFYPIPDVSSSFLYFKRKKNIDLNINETEIFHNLVKSAFWGRRKTLKKDISNSPYFNLNKEIISNIFSELDLDTNIRGENLSIEEFKNIAKTIYKNLLTL